MCALLLLCPRTLSNPYYKTHSNTCPNNTCTKQHVAGGHWNHLISLLFIICSKHAIQIMQHHGRCLITPSIGTTKITREHPQAQRDCTQAFLLCMFCSLLDTLTLTYVKNNSMQKLDHLHWHCQDSIN